RNINPKMPINSYGFISIYTYQICSNQMTHSRPSITAISAAEMNALSLENEFWLCSLKLWKNKTLQDTLLDLQDAQGFRVNLSLFAMWAGLMKKNITPLLPNINEELDSWHEQVVAPLRQVRKSLPKGALRKDVQQNELQAEQVEHALLFKLSQTIPFEQNGDTIDILIGNLLASRLPKSHLLLCIRTCLPNCSDSEIQSQICKHNISY
ncbi:DUF2390 domain-containing protein, partial [Oleiphilus sp. HI0123]